MARPNREIIAKLNEAYNDSLSVKLNGVNELTFSVPYDLDEHHRLVRNKNIDLIKERYLIKEVKGGKINWYVINSITDDVKDSGKTRMVTCNAAYHLLSDKAVRSYSVESKFCRQVLNDLLANTVWEIDYIDADFDLTYRAFDFPSSNVLEAIYSVAETYNAIVIFDTDKQTVSFQKPELTGVNRGLTFSHKKYMKSMNQAYQTDQMVTRLSPSGKDGLGIQRVNPTGQNYIENFGYFMYPFQRDSNRQVLTSSYHMSDSLCHALLDYEELVESKSGVFQAALAQLEKLEAKLNALEVDMNKLKNNEAVVTDTMITQQFDRKMFFEKYPHSGSSSREFTLHPTYAYAVMIKVDQNLGVHVSLNGEDKPTVSGQWVLLGKVKNLDSIQVSINGGSTGVFIQVANLSLEELENDRNDAEIIERYSLDNKQNQIRLKQIEIDNMNLSIKQVKEQITTLQTLLLAGNNFTKEQLQELNYFVIEREFNDDKYIDDHDLYKAALEKFKELQQPQLSIDMDIVNFLEIVEEQLNWNKLVLGDYINIKYEPTKTNVTARITEINFNYANSSVKLTLSNAKSVNDETKRIEKFLNDAKNTSVTVDTSKTKWGKAVVDSSEMSRLFENFWNKVTNDINMASNEYVTLDRKGLTIIDPNDPLRFLRATHGALGVTRSGGLNYESLMTPDGTIAEMVLGKIILGQRVVIGDTTGVFTIEGSRLMIDDRCGREVVKLGLLSERPDTFGMFLNRYASGDCADKTVVNKVKMTADEGFIIERIRNGIAEKTFGTSLDGDLFVKAGVDDQVFTIDKHGLALGSSVWSAAPFHADYLGNVWMSKLFADTAEIKNSMFQDGHITGSDITLGKHPNVIKLFPNQGFWAGHEDFSKAPASISMDGTAKFKKLMVTDGNSTLLMDSEKKKLYMNRWDLVGAGAVDAELITANMLTSADGFISNLTSGRLTTLTNTALTDWSNYIRIDKNSIKFITGKVKGSGTQKKLADGRPLYWMSAEQMGQMTTDVTAWPVLVYEMDEKVKQEITFSGSGDAANPVRTIGLGDGSPNGGGRAQERKYDGGFKTSYATNNSGKERSVDLADTGITLKSEAGKIMLTGKDISALAEGGPAKFGNDRAYIEMTADGKMIFHAVQFDFVNS
ncbi:phage tail protein [Paenibacillus tuaregi]|uniref:phage tail protein n=1 Tax=Paenibacillus tuaregi TaxID=1816681 RepID=UPI000A8F9839|nr:phage tail protein [Paenibacillus tuaregi]